MGTASYLDRLWGRGRAFLDADTAILGGAMTWLSERNLVAALSNGGGFGVLASGAMMPDQLSEEIRATKALTDRSFGVNLITMHPQLMALIDVCLDHKVSHIVLAGGIPPTVAIDRIRGGKTKILCFAPNLTLGRKLVQRGADALVIEGMEAGGHTGPVATSVLAQTILPNIRDVPVFVAGGIARGDAVLAYLEMGAAGCQLGTRFVCAEESVAHPRFKEAFIKAKARDAVLSVQLDPMFPVIPVRSLANKASNRFLEVQREVIDKFHSNALSKKDAQLEIEHFWAGALRRAVVDGDVENGSMMAGQSVDMVTCEQPAQEIIQELLDQAHVALEARTRV